jgi:hypothetical protein
MAESLEARLRKIEAEIAKGAKIGRLPSAAKKAAEMEAAVKRMFAARPSHELVQAMAELTAARRLSRETWERIRVSGPTAQTAAGRTARRFARTGGAAARIDMSLAAPGGGVRILYDWYAQVPHTYWTTAKPGRPSVRCETDKWFNKEFLVYDPAAEPGTRGHVDSAWLGLSGPKFRCYYPASSIADWESLRDSGSGGRWLNAWSQKSKYIKF